MSKYNDMIVIVSNDPHMNVTFKDELNRRGYTAVSYELHIFNASHLPDRPSVFILDINLEDDKHQGILSSIKSKWTQAPVPFIIVSDSNKLESKLSAFDSGANDYIVKPFELGEATARINVQIKISRAYSELFEKNKKLSEKNNYLKQQALTDELTGLYNKRYLETRLHCELSRSARFNEPIAFIMADIDYFKKINDDYGHLEGDAVLKQIAARLHSSVRETDIITRYGGEEFLIICPNTNLKEAQSIAERIRLNIQKSEFSIRNEQIKMTISLGIRCTRPKAPKFRPVINSLINEADIALYKAKTNGRNQVWAYIGNNTVIKCSPVI